MQTLSVNNIAGLDEAGRGPLAGPVVAAAVILDPHRPIANLNDSKKLSPRKRAHLYNVILENSLSVGISTISSLQIDQSNILAASLWAMKLAFEQLSIAAQEAWIDGNQKVPLESQIIQKTFVGGDAIYPCIMAASILAKVHRDNLMLEHAKQYPEYGFEKHKGYGTAAHLEAIKIHGPCPLHRMTFAPLKKT